MMKKLKKVLLLVKSNRYCRSIGVKAMRLETQHSQLLKALNVNEEAGVQ